jgi:hypothetical protein
MLYYLVLVDESVNPRGHFLVIKISQNEYLWAHTIFTTLYQRQIKEDSRRRIKPRSHRNQLAQHPSQLQISLPENGFSSEVRVFQPLATCFQYHFIGSAPLGSPPVLYCPSLAIEYRSSPDAVIICTCTRGVETIVINQTSSICTRAINRASWWTWGLVVRQSLLKLKLRADLVEEGTQLQQQYWTFGR